jgi:hypothetical protein
MTASSTAGSSFALSHVVARRLRVVYRESRVARSGTVVGVLDRDVSHILARSRRGEMTDQEEVNRAVAVINTAIRHNMFPAGVMPESDADKLVECEKLVVLCSQAKTVADAIGPTKVNNYQAVMEILMEAHMLVGANGDGTQPFVQQAQPAQEAQPSTPSSPPSPQASQPPASPPAAPTTSASAHGWAAAYAVAGVVCLVLAAYAIA